MKKVSSPVLADMCVIVHVQPKHAVELEVDSLRTVFLFTDGLANEGIQDTKALVGLLQRMLDKVCTCMFLFLCLCLEWNVSVCVFVLTFMLALTSMECVDLTVVLT